MGNVELARNFATNSIHGLLGRAIADVPIAVIDFETTGMFPGHDRVVEVSVVRIESGREPELVFDTLVNPDRPMGATFVHGITDQDVIDAPRFEEISGPFLRAISGCAIAAYNVAFDMRFLDYELNRLGVQHAFPHLCLMYMRPMLGLGRMCKLAEACRQHGVSMGLAHAAAPDALAAAKLWNVYARDLADRNVTTYRELAAIRRYKFTESFGRHPHPEHSLHGELNPNLKPRVVPIESWSEASARPTVLFQ
jgi:DNA polymerase-3 subunit epsilon